MFSYIFSILTIQWQSQWYVWELMLLPCSNYHWLCIYRINEQVINVALHWNEQKKGNEFELFKEREGEREEKGEIEEGKQICSVFWICTTLGEKERKKEKKFILFGHRRIIGDPSKMVHTQSWAVLMSFCLFPFFSVCNRFPTPVHTDVHTGIVLSDIPAAARRLGSRIEAALMYRKQSLTMARKQSFVIAYCGFTQARC